MQRYKVQTSGGIEYVEAADFAVKDGDYVFPSEGKVLARFSRGSVLYVVPVANESE